jgi:hypothetical protein
VRLLRFPCTYNTIQHLPVQSPACSRPSLQDCQSPLTYIARFRQVTIMLWNGRVSSTVCPPSSESHTGLVWCTLDKYTHNRYRNSLHTVPSLGNSEKTTTGKGILTVILAFGCTSRFWRRDRHACLRLVLPPYKKDRILGDAQTSSKPLAPYMGIHGVKSV